MTSLLEIQTRKWRIPISCMFNTVLLQYTENSQNPQTINENANLTHFLKSNCLLQSLLEIDGENCKQKSTPSEKLKKSRILSGNPKIMDRDKFEAFLAAINGNKYDIEAWHGMLRVIYNEKVEHYRDSVYERLVNVFPTSGKFWRIYIEHEVNFEVTKMWKKSFFIVF